MSPSCESASPQLLRRPHLRQLCDFISFACAFVVCIAIALSASSARAAITIKSAAGASNIEGVGTTLVVIYGGVAGNDCGSGANGTCSSCDLIAGSGDAGLQTCNDHRINPDLVLQISVSSDNVDNAYPIIASEATTAGTTGTTLTQVSGSVSPVGKGSTGTISVTWRNICGALATASTTGTTGTIGAVPTNCVLPAGTNYAVATFDVGLTPTPNATTTASADTAQIKIVLASGDLTTPGSTAPTGGSGITYYEVDSGDNKGTIAKLSCTTGSGFPNSDAIPIRWVRVLFEKRSDGNTPVWTAINRGSPHTDLAIGATGTCDTNDLNLSPVIFTSGTGYDASGAGYNVNVSNDSVYDTKVAVVDAAGNAEYYTPAANDDVCDGGTASVGGSGREECHTIRPSLVVGVLANQVNCFIATASYGSPMAREVDTFRHFRDTYLIPTKLGLKFVRWYYNEGPAYAHFIRQNDTYRAIARGFLWLPLQFAKVSLNYGIFAGLSFLGLILLAPVALVAWGVRIRRKRSVRINA